jgi:hypothetical protein
MTFNTSLLSVETKAEIYSAYVQGLPPSTVAKTLRLAMATVIAEYLRLDSLTKE